MILAAEKKLAEMEVRRVEHELATSRQELFNERREEKERQKRRDGELTVQKRLAVEAKAEISKVRQPLEAHALLLRRPPLRFRLLSGQPCFL